MKVLMTSTPAVGHLNRLLVIGRALVGEARSLARSAGTPAGFEGRPSVVWLARPPVRAGPGAPFALVRVSQALR
jgi:hypothetical protein